jgi:hypothetical protein
MVIAGKSPPFEEYICTRYVWHSANTCAAAMGSPQLPCAWCGEAAGGAASSWRSEAMRGARQVGGNVLQ